MNSVTALSTNPFLHSIEDRLREQLKETKQTSLGSEYVAFHASRDEVVALAASDLVSLFRRVVLDPVRGLVMLMSPSAPHDSISGYLDDFVASVSSLKRIETEKLRSTRWRQESDPKNTGNEADCSFYFGRKALDYIDALAQGKEVADAYSFRVPPDLVVEVGITSMSKEKYLSYRDKGAVEFWQLNVRPDKYGRSRVSATFLHLQAKSKPLEIDVSHNLPGITPVHVSRFVRLRTGKSLDYLEVYEAVRSLLEDEASGMVIREEAEEYEPAS